MADALIGLGGNLGDARATLDRAVSLFCDDVLVRLIARSSDYRTAPWGVSDQPPFINLCLRVETTLSPHDLLRRALSVEQHLGRDRATGTRWGPRAIDIDILVYDDLSIDEPDLRLPHPFLAQRAFVLIPLAEIAPDRMIGGVAIRDLAERIDSSGVERLASVSHQ